MKRTKGKKLKGKRRLPRPDQIGLISALSLFLLFYPGDNVYTSPEPLTKETTFLEDLLPEFNPSAYPLRKGLYPAPALSAQAVYIFDLDSGVPLYQKNEHLKLSPASTTKLMTALVAIDNHNLADILKVKNLVNEGKKMDLFYGEEMSVENLLYGMLVHSANDAAFVIADNYPGGVNNFVRAMNQKASEIGLKETNFTNPMGYDNQNQYTTAHNLAVLAAQALQNQTLAHMVGTRSITVADASYTYFHSLENVNELLGSIPGVAGVKTGFTEEAGENLVSLIKRQDKSIIVVVLKSSDRFSDTSLLIDWIFNEYSWEEINPTLSNPD